jgi:hypothetical protein
MTTMQVWAYRVPTTVDLKGYEVEAPDGSIGVVDESTGQVGENYLVVDTGPWIFGKRVLLPAGIVDRIDTADEKVFVDRSRDEIRNAPEYDPDQGAIEPYRRQVGSYYAAREARESRTQSPPTSRQRATRSQTPPASRQRATRSKTTQKKTSSSSRGRSRTQSRTSDEPTRDELYEQAKRLDIEGRSKMSKAELKRAVGRRSGQSASTQRRGSTSSQSGRRVSGGRGKANPVEVQTFLEGVSYPTRKGDLLREAERQGASKTVRSTLERLPEERFADPTEVSEAVGKLS